MPTKKPSAKQLAARAKFVKMVRAKAAKSKAAKKKTVNKKLGALPIGFSGSVWGVNFKVINQYSIYNDVSAIVEDKKNGNTIVVFDGVGNSKDKADTMVSYFAKNTNTTFDDSDKKALKSRMLKFAANMQMEVKNFNAGKKKTIKKSPLVILKPIAPKKPTFKKTTKKKTIKQTGGSNLLYDKRLQALKPGKRISKKGNKYTENRENRSDKGMLLGLNNNVVGKFFALEEYKKKLAAIKNFENIILKIKSSLPTVKYKHSKDALKKELVYVKKMLAEYKTHARELKKLV
jgi:hypothetical protein